MIDTVILTISERAYRILNYKRFGTTPEEIERVQGFKKFPNNPTSEESKKNYYPRLTLIRRFPISELKVEFSAPKIIHRNNVDEVSESDFWKEAHILHERIKDMGVLLLNEQSLAYADVSTLHISKNIPLSGHTANYVIRELHKIDLHSKLDLTSVQFRNGGYSLQMYSTSYSIVFYDKYADIALPHNRRVDADAGYQPDIFNPRFEILRMEVRITNKNKLNALLEQLGYSKNPCFRDVFKKDLCQKILQHYWQTIIMGSNRFLFSPTLEPQKFYALAKERHPEFSNKKVIYLVGLDALARDRGIRGLKTLVKRYNSARTWIRIKQDIKRLDGLKPDDHGLGFISEIKRALEEFKPYRIDSEIAKKLST